MKNMHIPIPEETHAVLMAHAKASGQSATALARGAIEELARDLEHRRIRAELQAYARAVAGTPDDHDPELSALGQDVWERQG